MSEELQAGRDVTDARLVQIVDAALADAARRSGDWLVCKPGCTQCCVGAFAINALDVARLQKGCDEMRAFDPGRWSTLGRRVHEYLARTSTLYPGDPSTGVLDSSSEGLAAFESFANDEMCPVLDPATGLCDLYAHRPMTCRVFGPPVRGYADDGGDESGLGVCELCFVGASPEEIAACEMVPDPEGLEDFLLREMSGSSENQTETTVAYAIFTYLRGCGSESGEN